MLRTGFVYRVVRFGMPGGDVIIMIGRQMHRYVTYLVGWFSYISLKDYKFAPKGGRVSFLASVFQTAIDFYSSDRSERRSSPAAD